MSKIVHLKGDLFAAPQNSILVHACNTLGAWGGGIALAFKVKYPLQFVQYKAYCDEHMQAQDLIGTCLLLRGDKHDIACLFTSRAYGRQKDTPEEILAATRTALQDLVKQNKIGKPLHACRFNSGKFGVPWEWTEAIIKELDIAMKIYEPLEHPVITKASNTRRS